MIILIRLIKLSILSIESGLEVRRYFSSRTGLMSIIKQRFSITALILAEILFFSFVAAAQEFEATVEISSSSFVKIEGKFLKENFSQSRKNWSFLNSVGGVENLGARVSYFSVFDKQGRAISINKLTDSEFLAEEIADSFKYQINLSSLQSITGKAHVSWLSGEQGILMLDDLLPQFNSNNQPVSARIKFELPADWKIISSEKKSNETTFEVKNVEKAIFGIGKAWRKQEISINKSSLNLAVAGERQFSDAEALQMASGIYENYQTLFGEPPTEKVQIFLMRFPKEIKFGRWEAEARGSTLTILSADMPFKTQSLQLLHEQLRHELFHLWLPNNLNLTGNYDWFYEGFTVYQALRTGIAMNQIRFEDFLDTLAQAYNLDNLQDRRTSLIESSKNRWSGANSQVYARGMLVAFLCDVALLRKSKGKRSISEIFRAIYEKYHIPSPPEDGNAAILKALQNYPELDLIIEKYVAGAEKVNWEASLQSIGIETEEENLVARLKVKAKPSGKQKDLLDKLGYNNWRKISERRK